MIKHMKAALIGLGLLFSVGCGAAEWMAVPAAVEPVAQHTFPIAGETLNELAAAFKLLCPVATEDHPRSATCEHAKTVLNSAIKAYTEANSLVEDSQ